MTRRVWDCKGSLLLWITALALVSAAWGADAQKRPAEPPAPAASAPVRKLLDQAVALLTLQKPAEGLAAADEALDVARQAKDAPGEALAERQRALNLEALNELSKAAAAWKRTAEAWERAGDGPGQIESLANAAILLPESPEREKSLARAVEIAIQERRRPLAAGAVAHAAGDRADDLKWARGARDLVAAAIRIRERYAIGTLDLASSLNLAGYLAYSRREVPAAKDFYNRALAILEKLAPTSPERVNVLNTLGMIAYARGDLAAGREYLQHALETEEKLAAGSLDEAGILNNLGEMTRLQGDLPAAKLNYQRALVILEKLAPESLNVAAVLNNLGLVDYTQGDFAAAREYLRRALAIREKLTPGSLDVGASLNNLGEVARLQGDLAAAKLNYQRALVILEKLAPESQTAAAVLNNLGLVDYTQGDFAAAKENLQRALAIREKLDPGSLDVAASLNNLGELARLQGDLAAAKLNYQRALVILEKLAPESLTAAAVLNNLGLVDYAQDDFAAGREYLQRALAIREKLSPGSLDAAATLSSLGAIAWGQGRLGGARDYFQRALVIWAKLVPGSLVLAGGLNNLGEVARLQGDLAAAKEILLRARAIQEKLAPESSDFAAVLNNLGIVAEYQGDLGAGKAYHQRALAIRVKLAPGSLDVAGSLNNLGEIARQQGDLDAASQYYQSALVIQEKLASNSLDVADSLNNLGLVAWLQDNLPAAKGYYQRALAVQEKLAPDSLDVARSRSNLGLVSYNQGDLAAAEEYYQRALAIQDKQAPGSLAVAGSLNNLGRLAYRQGDLEAAEGHFRQAWDLVRNQGARVGGDEARQAFGTQYGRYAADLVACRLQKKETGDALVTLEEGRAQALQQLLDERGVTASLAPPELWKTYQERLSAKQQALRSLERAGAAESKDEARLALAVGDAEKTASRSRLEQDRKETAAQRDTYVVVRVEMEHAWAAVKDAVALAHPEVLPKPEAPAAAIAALPAGELAVEFSVGEQESTVFLVSHGTPVQAFPLKISLKDLTELVGVVRKQVSGDEGGRAAALAGEEDLRTERLRSTYRQLFPAEARAALRAAHRVVFCPDGPLWELPFAALITNETGDPEYLGLQKPLTYAQSLTVFLRTLQSSAPAPGTVDLRQALIVGNPLYDNARRAALSPGSAVILTAPPGPPVSPIQLAEVPPAESQRALLTRDGNAPSQLPHAEEEAKRVAAIYGARAHVLAEPTEAWFREHAPSAPLIHLATHGYLRPNQPLSSGVLLAVPEEQSAVSSQRSAAAGQQSTDSENDGALQAWKILQFHLKADLVVLSACETGLGSRVPGEGLIGLTRAWQIAGARSVVASEWKVDDASTAALMEAFHRELKQGLAKDEALRRAMQATAKQYPHPYFWAPFLLVGDPENHLVTKSEK